MSTSAVPWHRPFRERRCPKRGGDGEDWGRCELRRDHDGDCALERGMYVLRFGPGRVYVDGAA